MDKLNTPLYLNNGFNANSNVKLEIIENSDYNIYFSSKEVTFKDDTSKVRGRFFRTSLVSSIRKIKIVPNLINCYN
jgi:hypothetical protein